MRIARNASRGSADLPPNPTPKLPEDGYDNLEYFLKVMRMEKYEEIFLVNNIRTLAELRSKLPLISEVKKEKFDEMGLPLSDQVKLVKKLRDMGL